MRQETPNILDNVLPLNAAAPAPPTTTLLALAAITNDGGTQMRAGMNADTVKEYEDALTDADAWPFPPVVVYHDGARYWLADGFHRLNAAHRSGKFQEIPADIKPGTRRDAVLYAAGANAGHGLRRNNDDKERAVKALLEDDEWRKWSDNEIAKRCAVSQPFVSALRKKLAATYNDYKSPTERIGADGRTYNTQNIGSKPAAHQSEPIRYAEIWQLQGIVQGLAMSPDQLGAFDAKTIAELLRRAAANRSADDFWNACIASIQKQRLQHRTSDLVQAINNYAGQIEAKYNGVPPILRPAPEPHGDLHTGAGRTPPPPLTVAEIVEELTPHLAGFAPGNISGAALGLQNDVAERCALVLSDFTYQQADLRRALQRIANDRHLAMSKEASAAVASVDRPLPAWAAEPEPATVAQTVADVVEVHGEPAPVAVPAETLPVSQRADYESDEWYTPQEYIDAAREVMGEIDLDPASSELAQTVVRANVYLTRFDDGLRQVRWIHQRIWLNPPYSNPAPWIEKLVREHQAGPYCTEAIVLVNNATETSWFQLLLENFPVCLPARRLAFWRYDHANVGARQGQAFFYLGANADKFEQVFKRFGPILRRVA